MNTFSSTTAVFRHFFSVCVLFFPFFDLVFVGLNGTLPHIKSHGKFKLAKNAELSLYTHNNF